MVGTGPSGGREKVLMWEIGLQHQHSNIWIPTSGGSHISSFGICISVWRTRLRKWETQAPLTGRVAGRRATFQIYFPMVEDAAFGINPPRPLRHLIPHRSWCGSIRKRPSSNPELTEHERVVFGDLVKSLKSPGAAAVTGFHVGAQNQEVVIGLCVAQARHVLGRLPVLHLRVP
jgi:hypothetical protein